MSKGRVLLAYSGGLGEAMGKTVGLMGSTQVRRLLLRS